MRRALVGLNRRTGERESGQALIVAMMVMGVGIALSLVGIQVAQSATRSSGYDRQRLLAVNAAEAGVDQAYVAIAQGALAPPCSLGPTTVKGGPDTVSYTTTVTYLTATGASATASGCSFTAIPKQALIRSTATSSALGGGTTFAARTVEALVNLNPVNGNSLNKAIFADGTLSFSNQTTLTGNNGADADIYSNTNVDCSNNENFAGSVYSQGNISISNKCTFAGNVWAKGSISTNSGSNGSVAGFMKAATGSISLSGVSVAGNLYAAGSISYSQCSTAGKCYPGSSPGAPPTVPFPILRGDSATQGVWTSNGFTVYTDNNCSSVKDDIINTYAKKGSPTFVRTTCAVNFSKDKTIPLSNDLAVFANGGFSSSNQVGFASSSSGTAHNMYWVVPYDYQGTGTTPTRPCTSPSITTDQQFSLSNDVNMFLYNPCSISFANNSTHIGQIYGGSDVAINNKFSMQYRPVPVFGIDPSSIPQVGFSPSVVYKRETR